MRENKQSGIHSGRSSASAFTGPFDVVSPLHNAIQHIWIGAKASGSNVLEIRLLLRGQGFQLGVGVCRQTLIETVVCGFESCLRSFRPLPDV